MRSVGLICAGALCLIAVQAGGWSAPTAGTRPADVPAPAGVQVRDAWIRWLPGDVPSGGYLTLVNGGNTAVRLAGASSADYGSVSLHRSRAEGGVSRMTPVTAIAVQAHTTLDFAAQGYHLMLSEPKRALHAGDHVVIVLRFEGGNSLPVPFELRPPDMLMSK